VIDLEIDASGDGSGTLAPAAKVTVSGSAFVVEDYASELVRLAGVKKVKEMPSSPCQCCGLASPWLRLWVRFVFGSPLHSSNTIKQLQARAATTADRNRTRRSQPSARRI
jgi:hypothetical protein